MITVDEIKTVAIIGNGLMGQGIAQVFARAGKNVVLIGRSGESLARAMSVISTNFQAFVERGLSEHDDIIAAIGRIRTSTDMKDAASADFVIEAVPAVRDLQISIFKQLDQICAPEIVLGSTSGQPISLMSVEMQHPERAVAIHFVYPAQLIPVVEVCGGPDTRPDVVTWACDMLESVGQVAAPMMKEVDGFIINRLQFALLREAWSMWAEGVASAEAIDNSFKMTLGRRYSVTGPIESADMGGLDIMNTFAEFLLPSLNTDKHPPAALGELVKGGNFGLKSGKGVYDWSQRDGKARLAARADRLFQHMAEDAAEQA
ncbi:3-hydroxyadipyl-CoA dehydrogenase [Roseovarius litorisediminis]|uniref:L-gulonate 3-dehydrogenase n=1 Tax=Roseovarius litorisediminis TaxID=1312363 RepID=A0A1Y5S0H5_9RHOB|nr:3-hydroxyacyl-CoA dehydrogenase family protein [Roseovarius litorisediminis]SLN29900.1 3-hydroxyadipyl-CoA dehydrogenase [Roseovarius litorisediminis]